MNWTLFSCQVDTRESKIGHLVIVEFNKKSFYVKIVSKNASKPVNAKMLISNLFLVAYKMFLYKILIKAAIEAHKHDGTVAIWVGGGHISRIFGHVSGAPVSCGEESKQSKITIKN